MKNPIQTTFKYGVLGVASMAILASAAAEAAWKPSKQLEILTHVRTTSSTYRFAKAVEKAAKPMLKKGVKVLSIRGARGDRARRHLSIKNKANNHMMQVITPSQVNNPILAKQKNPPVALHTVGTDGRFTEPDDGKCQFALQNDERRDGQSLCQSGQSYPWRRRLR